MGRILFAVLSFGFDFSDLSRQKRSVYRRNGESCEANCGRTDGKGVLAMLFWKERLNDQPQRRAKWLVLAIKRTRYKVLNYLAWGLI